MTINPKDLTKINKTSKRIYQNLEPKKRYTLEQKLYCLQTKKTKMK